VAVLADLHLAVLAVLADLHLAVLAGHRELLQRSMGEGGPSAKGTGQGSVREDFFKIFYVRKPNTYAPTSAPT